MRDNEAVIERAIGDLDEVLDNLGVFRSLPTELVAPCPSGFRRVPITRGEGYYLSLQGFGPDQIAYAHTHPDSEEWVVVLEGSGRALFGDSPVELTPGLVVGRGASYPHGFMSGVESLTLLSIQLPRPGEGATSWDQPGETSEPVQCGWGGVCRRCYRCGGHSLLMPAGRFSCENCDLSF